MTTHAILLRPASGPLSRRIATALGVAFFTTLGLSYFATTDLRGRASRPAAAYSDVRSGSEQPSAVTSSSTADSDTRVRGAEGVRSAPPPAARVVEETPPRRSFSVRESAPGRFISADLAPLHAWSGFLNRHPEQRILVLIAGDRADERAAQSRRLAAVMRLLSLDGVSVHRIRVGITNGTGEGPVANPRDALRGAAGRPGGVTVTLETDPG